MQKDARMARSPSIPVLSRLLLLTMLISVSPDCSAQDAPPSARRLRCTPQLTAHGVRAEPSVRVRDSLEACTAVARSIQLVTLYFPSAVDSAKVVRHDVPDLRTGVVLSAYQTGVYLSNKRAFDITIDRRNWAILTPFPPIPPKGHSPP